MPSEFDTAANKIANELDTEHQRLAFREVSGARRVQIGAFADRHALQQRQVFAQGQFEAEIDSSMNRTAMLVGAGDMQTAKAETSIAQARTVGYLRSQGKSEEEIAVAVRAVSSKAGVLAVSSLLEQDKPTEAERYLKDNAGSMSADDLIRAQGAVKKSLTARDSLTIADEVYTASVVPALRPPAANRLENLVMQAESGGKRFGADGKLLQGPVTRFGERAQGEMQVMPSTARDPGYGIKPADLSGNPDEQAGEVARVGREKLQIMLKRYAGDVPKALAAYNWGEGNVDKAVADAAKGRSGSADWLSYAPAETKAYVQKITAQYDGGAGAAPMPSLQALHDQVRSRVPADRPELRKQTIEETTRRYQEGLTAQKQVDEQKLIGAYDWLVANNGAFARMPAQIRNGIPSTKFDDVMTFAGKVSAGVPVETDWNAYAGLRALAASEPAKFVKTDLRAYFPTIAPAQREQLIDLQMKAANPATTHEVATLDAQLGNAHDLLKLAPSDKEKKGKFDTVVMTELSVAQREKGKPLTFEERQKVIDRNLLTTDAGAGWFSRGKRVYETAGTADGLTAKPVPTDEDKKLIKAALAAEGVKAPTDSQIVGRFNLKHGFR